MQMELKTKYAAQLPTCLNNTIGDDCVGCDFAKENGCALEALNALERRKNGKT